MPRPVSRHQVFLVVDTVIRPLISLCRVLVVPVPRVSNATMMAVATMLGAASGSQQGAKCRTECSSGKPRGEVLLEVVQAVVKTLG